MPSILCMVDDKHVPLYRVMWVSAVPHFCGSEDCMCEGLYEVRLEEEESVWARRDERDSLLAALEQWQGGLGVEEDEWD
ncbi:MAG: hypothetical protein GXY58_07110 [Planctomycetaceae bacterium]|nr:hypothetical protein [Planctomycetaceae bacterium]